MRFIVTLIWAVLIGAAIAYVLASMGQEPFSMEQSIAFSAISFVFLLFVDIALSSNKQEN